MKFVESNLNEYPSILCEVQPLDPGLTEVVEFNAELNWFLKQFKKFEDVWGMDVPRAKSRSSQNRMALRNLLKIAALLLI
jgi:hypothetical protein